MNFRSFIIAIVVSFVAASSAQLAVSGSQGKPPDKALLDAVESGDRQKVMALLAQGANVNAKGINNTALEVAIFQQDVEMARLLLERGAKIEARDLGEAAHGAQGDTAKATLLVRLLLDKGANLRACAEEAADEASAKRCTKTAGEDGLRESATRNNLEVMRLFLAKGVPVNSKDRFGQSVLMEAVHVDSLDAVQVLLEAGADVKAANDRQETVLMQAARADRRSNIDLRLRLLKSLLGHGADVRAKDGSGQTALHYAVQQMMSESGGFLAHAEIVRLLLESGADVNAQDDRGKSPLMTLAQMWKAPVTIAQLLLEKEADVNLPDKEGATALMLAAEKGRSDLVLLLIEKGASIDAKDKLGRTAIVYGTEAGEPEVVALLAQKGAHLSLTAYKTQDELRAALHNFALLKAVGLRRIEEVKGLLEGGADVNARSRNGATALMLATEYNYQDNGLIGLLLAKGADVNAADQKGETALTVAAARNDRESVKLLLDRKAEVNVRTKEGKTPLLVAADGGSTGVAELLLARGADVRVRDNDQRTALLLACNSDHAQSELVQLLLENNGDANARDRDGNTPLILAARSGAFQVIAALTRGGADVNATNKGGWTALREVKESKETWTKQSWAAGTRAEVVRLLHEAGAKE